VRSTSPAYLAYRGGAAAANLLPQSLVEPVARAAGLVAASVATGRRRQVERNLERVRPSQDAAARRRDVVATFSSYAHYWLESFRLPGTSPEVLARHFSADGDHHIRRAIDAGSGVILALPHLGGWEWAAFWLTAVNHYRVTAVAEVVEPPELAEWFVGLREQFGMTIVPLDRSAGGASVRALKENQILCLVADRDIQGGGVEVEFFGETTTLPGGPATLALRTGAPLLPTAVYFDGGRDHHAVIGPPLDLTRSGSLRRDVARVTQDLAARFEQLISRAPEQWHLLQPNWPSDEGRP
jgi:KDO2-lipid IV(A) lauroyltransferase